MVHADVTKRPPQEAQKALQSFQMLLQRYQKSPYGADARQRMIYLRNRLADYEVSVARYYMKRGAYVGAANRARNVIEGYDGAPAVVVALQITADAYRKLGMEDMAKVADDVRAANNLPDTVGPAAPGSASAAGLAMSPETRGQVRNGATARNQRWEARVGLTSANSTDVDFEGGTTATIDGGIGFTAGFAYHYNDRIQVGSTFTYDQKDYSAVLVGDQPDNFAINGSLDSMTLMVDAAYSFLTGPLTPFVSAGLGWTWVDTNITNAPPDIGCWWNPWWGYICTSYQNTKTVDGLAYELGLGLRYDYSYNLFVDGSYKMKWVDFDNANGSPSFDGLQLNLGWKF
jgi:opacity protein-like surface antigen